LTFRTGIPSGLGARHAPKPKSRIRPSLFCPFSMQFQLPKFSSCLYSSTPSTKDRKDRDALHKSLLFVKTASSIHSTSMVESRKQLVNNSPANHSAGLPPTKIGRLPTKFISRSLMTDDRFLSADIVGQSADFYRSSDIGLTR